LRQEKGLVAGALSAVEGHPALLPLLTLHWGLYCATIRKFKVYKSAYIKINYFVKGEDATPSSSPRKDTVIHKKEQQEKNGFAGVELLASSASPRLRQTRAFPELTVAVPPPSPSADERTKRAPIRAKKEEGRGTGLACADSSRSVLIIFDVSWLT
jgi:hypothetical protein